ncbi:MAG: hypothetical protein M1827_001938 [Pycnora praestabilis]|nr:MAG: hypothetical protein M1827_001938 [Pycnora praestabilis]
MAVSLALAVPAAAAAYAYFDAKTDFSYDCNIFSCLVKGSLLLLRAQKLDRLNLFYVLEDHARSRQRADRTFIWYEGREWTYKQTYDLVLKYATWLKTKYDITSGEIVAMDFMNSPTFGFFWLALWSLGARPAFINYNLTGKSLLHCIKTSSARVLLVDEEVKPAFTKEVTDELASPSIRDGKGPVETVFFTQELRSEITSTVGIREPDSVRSGAKIPDMAVLIFTSGTTGLPKAAIVNWSKFKMGGMFVTQWMNWTKDERIYTCMPLYHGSACILAFCAALNSGTSIAIGHKFSNRTFWPEVRASGATIVQYVGETCRYLLANPPQLDPQTGENIDAKNKVRIAFGNGLRPDIWNRFKERFGIQTVAEFYSATESTSGNWNLSSNDYSLGAVGRNGTLARLVLGSQLTFVQLDWETEMPWRDPKTGFCVKVDNGLVGELLNRVDAEDIGALYQGYFNNKKASDSKILRDVFVKGDAWYRTGDLMKWNDGGRMYFVDRIGDTFRWKSENVSTNEVSEALGHHPSIQEANIYGVSIPHHDGRAGCACLVLSTPSSSSTSSTSPTVLQSLYDHAQNTLPKYAVPVFLRITKQMERTGNNKFQKHVLREQGVDPGLVLGKGGGDELFWLQGGTYRPFADKEWQELQGGKVML